MLAKLSVLSTLLLASSSVYAAATDFPSFDIFHSHCGLNVKYQNVLCVDAFQKIYNTVLQFNAGGDPAQGAYLLKEKQPISYIWTTHKSSEGWYSDVIFETNQLADGCYITGRSRTQSSLHSAGNDNFCDIWNVLNSAGTISNQGLNSCSNSPTDPENQCKKNKFLA
ncbi:UNKNOWN [Stylonychia lemnae]|uniref:C-type lectin domain-containing protein n=1 Tax=Stylonychia lemnae TaxID=5949 RepID=A0A078A609_STYLE|nr:UNKNOWN [Stylonychia lemnae]|eukprot:CDW77680.1 UNKNOWN [Stylonychia lemnae]